MLKKIFTIFIVSSILSSGPLVNCTFAQSWQAGFRTINFTDPDRSNRNISCDVYHPSDNGGQNVPMAEGVFPHVVFGHGFIMNVSAYESIAEALAENGFIVLLPSTETGLLPSHTQFARDLAFVADEVISRGESQGDFFFGHVNGNFSIGGHSMGGGCAYLSVQYLNNPASCLFTFAAAETNPSAIAQMSSLATPNLVLAAELDCVTPPEDHQILMYDAQSGDDCKFYLELTGAYHCQFNDFNFNCNLGESFCSPPGGLTRPAQIELTLEILIPWLNSFLYQDCDSWSDFLNLIEDEAGFQAEYICSIEVPDLPTISVTGNQPACPGDVLILEAGNNAGEIIWNTGDEGPEIQISEAGVYFFSQTTQICIQQSQSIEAEFILDPHYQVINPSGNELCPGEFIELLADPLIGNVVWNTDETGYSITVNEAGIYSFLAEFNGCFFHSNEVELSELVDPLFEVIAPQGNILCPESTILLEVSDFSTLVFWNTGNTQPVIEVEEAGIYFYEVTIGNCLFFSDTMEVIREDLGFLEVIARGDTLLCPGDSVLLITNTVNDILWSTGELSDTIVVFESGTFSYQVFTEYCIFESKEKNIIVRDPVFPTILMDGPSFMCPGDTAFLGVSLSDSEILWSNGFADSVIAVTTSGVYYYKATIEGCIYQSDTIELSFTQNPGFMVIADGNLELCQGDTLTLRTSLNEIEVVWSIGDTSESIEIMDSGGYFYSVGDSNCVFYSDTLIVEIILEPDYEIFSDMLTENCPGDSVLLRVENSTGNVIWSDGLIGDSLWIYDSGLYYFSIMVENCSFKGEKFEVEFRASWQTNFIEGPDTLERGKNYVFEVPFYDFLIYDWNVSGAEIVSGFFTNSVNLFIPEDASDEVELSVFITDRVCSEIFLNRKLFLQPTVQVLNVPKPVFVLQDHGYFWLLMFAEPIDGGQFILTDQIGRLVRSWTEGRELNIKISKESLLPGIYFLELLNNHPHRLGLKLIVLQ